MRIFKKLLFTASLLLIDPLAFSSDLDSADQEALQKTQKMLRDKKLRNNAIQNTKGAQGAHDKAVNAVGSGNIDEFYDISADVMAELVQLANGDASKMQMILQKAAKNPEEFYNSLSPKAREAIKSISKKKAH